MIGDDETSDTTYARTLNTAFEDGFVTPLTAVRGALEILRDYPDLSTSERQQFVANALAECQRIERAVDALGATVYAASRPDSQPQSKTLSVASSTATDGAPHEADADTSRPYRSRMTTFDDTDVIEVDFSEIEFQSSKMVHTFYDALEDIVKASGQRWFFLVNYRNCSVWPTAWVAFAHRGKKMNVGYSRGTVRYSEVDATAGASSSAAPRQNPDMYASRAQALAQIEQLRHRDAKG